MKKAEGGIPRNPKKPRKLKKISFLGFLRRWQEIWVKKGASENPNKVCDQPSVTLNLSSDQFSRSE